MTGLDGCVWIIRYIIGFPFVGRNSSSFFCSFKIGLSCYELVFDLVFLFVCSGCYLVLTALYVMVLRLLFAFGVLFVEFL